MVANQPVTAATDPAAIAVTVRQLGPWFHNIHLPGGTQTEPNHFLGDFPAVMWKHTGPQIPQDLRGWRVLDIGCNAGFYSFELAKRGAEVLGIDVDLHYLRQARWLHEQFYSDLNIKFQQMPVYDIARLPTSEAFDLVWFMGVFYHLRHPLLALDIAAQRTRRLMVFQTLMMPSENVIDTPDDMEIHERDAMLLPGWPKMAFIEKRLADDPTNWWAPNLACVQAMLRSSGLRIISSPAMETFICEPDPNCDSTIQAMVDAERRAATGNV
jgi:tRNA (mo5U34)-methyltransferase